MKRKAKIGKEEPGILSRILGIILVAYAAILILMFAWAIVNSLKKTTEFYINAVSLPKSPQFVNFLKALQGIRVRARIKGVDYYIYLPEMFLNSLLYAAGCAFFATLAPCITAYATARYKFKFNSVIYGIVIFAMVTPIVGSVPSQIEMAKKLGFYDTMWGMYFMSFTFLGTYYLMFLATFKTLSRDYSDAAAVDGAGHFTVMTRIMFPLVKNTFFAIFVLLFINYWNDYQTAWLFLPNTPTAAVGLQFFRLAAEPRYRDVTVQLAGSLLLLIPVIILFTAFRDKLMGNLTVGGIKG